MGVQFYTPHITMKYFPILLLISFSSMVLGEILVTDRRGVTHELKDGCPENAESNQLEEYLLCAATEVLNTQCKTEHLGDGGKDTFPVATDLCSALCWGEDTNTVTDCPNSGARRGLGK